MCGHHSQYVGFWNKTPILRVFNTAWPPVKHERSSSCSIMFPNGALKKSVDISARYLIECETLPSFPSHVGRSLLETVHHSCHKQWTDSLWHVCVSFICPSRVKDSRLDVLIWNPLVGLSSCITNNNNNNKKNWPSSYVDDDQGTFRSSLSFRYILSVTWLHFLTG